VTVKALALSGTPSAASGSASAATLTFGNLDAKGGIALATSTVTGSFDPNTGNMTGNHADAKTTAYLGTNLVLEIDAQADALGSGKIEARTAIGETEPAFSSNLQGVAIATGMAGTSITQADTAVSAVLNNNPNVKSAYGASPEFWALGELGDKISGLKPGDTQETATSSFNVFADLTKSARHDLLVGLYGPVVANAGKINEIILDVTLGAGTSLEHADFVTDISGTAAAKATAFFTDHPLDLGSLNAAPFNPSGTNEISIKLTVTGGSGAGFYAGFVVGDPPPGAVPNLATASAAFGGDAGNSQRGFESQHRGHSMLDS
jgi:hypothetical protein